MRRSRWRPTICEEERWAAPGLKNIVVGLFFIRNLPIF